MSEIFFIGDTHFGHRGILSFSSTKELRPFTTIEEHDAELVRRWNAAVGAKDKVFMLGDFCFGKRNIDIAGELNGYKVLIAGNHDMYATEDYLKYFKKVCGVCEYKGAVLTHIPVHPSQFPRYFMNIHGHLHNHILNDYRYFNCSAERINLTPIAYDIILNQWAENN
jgi:calcineurin-like phosphoesterase family protein